MHYKILRRLLQLFFVILLLTILGMQWLIAEGRPSMEEAAKQETEYYHFVMPKYTLSPERQNVEIKIY